MKEPTYVHVYQAVTCMSMFSTIPYSATAPLPPSVFVECEVCKTKHNFNHLRSHIVISEKSKSQLADHLKKLGLTVQNVSLI